MISTKDATLCLDTLRTQAALVATTRNAKINIALWALTLWLVQRQNNAFWLVVHPLLIFLVNMSERFLGLTIWSREDASKILYNTIQFLTRNPYGAGLDLGFNFYNGDYGKDAAQAQLDKFEHAWKLLGLQEGARVLDCGCGMGDWLYWLQTEKKCQVTGINMTLSHAMTCRNRGLTCILSDWQTLYNNKSEFEKLKGQFDVISFWDTVEHYCKVSEITVLNGWLRDWSGSNEGKNEAAERKVYGSMFNMARELLDPKSTMGKVWISCLHFNHRWEDENFYGKTQCYMMTSYYDGSYPWLKDGLSKHANGFDLVEMEDRTEDYRMTSLLNRDHFGYLKHALTPGAILTSLCNIVTNPQFLVIHIDFVRSALGFETAWMWHLGGIDPNKPKENPIASLYWQVYQQTASGGDIEIKKEK